MAVPNLTFLIVGPGPYLNQHDNTAVLVSSKPAWQLSTEERWSMWAHGYARAVECQLECVTSLVTVADPDPIDVEQDVVVPACENLTSLEFSPRVESSKVAVPVFLSPRPNLGQSQFAVIVDLQSRRLADLPDFVHLVKQQIEWELPNDFSLPPDAIHEVSNSYLEVGENACAPDMYLPVEMTLADSHICGVLKLGKAIGVGVYEAFLFVAAAMDSLPANLKLTRTLKWVSQQGPLVVKADIATILHAKGVKKTQGAESRHDN